MKRNGTSAGKRAADLKRPRDASSTDRLFVLHTGLHKTGSTALQAYLAHNADRLMDAGVAYAFAPGKAESPGNGQHLYELIRKGAITATEMDDLLTLHLGNCPTAIISSEDFSHFGLAEWQRVVEASQRLNARIRTVTFVRDIAPYYSSLHAQLLGAGEATTGFQEFSARAEIFIPVMDSLKCLMQTFQRESMSVIHYESVVGAIDKAFLGTLGLPCESYDTAPLLERVNRSLTEFEQDIILNVTKSTGIQFARGLSGHLKARRPQLRFTRTYDASLVAQLGARHAADVEWINKSFFGGEEVLQVSRSTPGGHSQNGPSATECIAIYRDVIDWCLDKLKISQDENFRYMGRRLQDIDWNSATNPLVPPDFDPIAYLAQNPDVLRRGSPPYRHFIDYGHKEPNRRWKWTS